MKLSTKGRYGVQALFELALHEGAGPVSLKLIAERQTLSEHYLEQLAAPLRKAGLISSVRGAQGGYVLGRPAAKITVGDVLRVLEGPLDADEEDPAGAGSPTSDVWRRVRQAIIDVVDSITLADLVAGAPDQIARQNLTFSI